MPTMFGYDTPEEAAVKKAAAKKEKFTVELVEPAKHPEKVAAFTQHPKAAPKPEKTAEEKDAYKKAWLAKREEETKFKSQMNHGAIGARVVNDPEEQARVQRYRKEQADALKKRAEEAAILKRRRVEAYNFHNQQTLQELQATKQVRVPENLGSHDRPEVIAVREKMRAAQHNNPINGLFKKYKPIEHVDPTLEIRGKTPIKV